MDSALAWIGQLADWIGRFFPRRMILDTTQAAIKYIGGKKPVVCGPGIHWYWPWRSTWVGYPTARQGDRLETQTMVTKDDKTIIVGGMLIYRVDDIAKLIPTTYSASSTVKDIAMTAVHDVCCNLDWTDLKSEQQRGTLDTKLKNNAQKQLADYGVKVEKLMLITLSPARVIKISQSTSQEEN